MLEVHKKGLYADDFVEAFKKVHGVPLDLEGIGYYHIMELVSQLDDIFGLYPDTVKGKKIIYDARQPVPKIQETNKKLPIPEELIHIIEQILLIYPDGISLPRLEEDYKLNCKTELNYMSFGFFSIDSFIDNLMSFIPKFKLFEGLCLINFSIST